MEKIIKYTDPVKEARHQKELREILNDIKYDVFAHMKNYNFTHRDNQISIDDVCNFINPKKEK